MVTDVGVVRDHNEDSAYIDPESQFFIVADGMGGHAAGEVASAMAVETVRQQLEGARDQVREMAESPSEDRRQALVTLLEAAVKKAHAAVFQRGVDEPDKQGMGTTLDVVLLAGPEAFVAHVGDSRTYLFRDRRTSQITTDHTVAEVLVLEGKLSIEEAQMSPLRTILVNAIGVAPEVGVEMAHIHLRTGDQLLMCSDGLHDYFPLEQELGERLIGADPQPALTEVVELAKQRGGHDNITGVLVDVTHAEPSEDSADSGAAEAVDGQETTSKRAVSDGVPQEIGRDDTLPVGSAEGDDDDQEAADRPVRQQDKTAPYFGAPAPSAAASDDEADADDDRDDDATDDEATADASEAEDPGPDQPQAATGESAADSDAPAAAKADAGDDVDPTDAGDDESESQKAAADADKNGEADAAKFVEDDTLIGYDPRSSKKPATDKAKKSASSTATEKAEAERDASDDGEPDTVTAENGQDTGTGAG